MLLGGGAVDRRTGRACPRCPPARRTPSTWSTAPTEVRPALTRLLHKTAVVDDLPRPRGAWSPTSPTWSRSTRDGDLLGAHFAAGGSNASRAYRDPGRRRRGDAALADAVAASERLGFDLSRLEGERDRGQAPCDVALAKLHESDATLAAVAEELGQHGSLARSARAEADRLARRSPRPRPLASRPRRHRRARGAARLGRGDRRRGARHRREGAPGPGLPEPRGRPRWRRGSRCAPPRSAAARCTAGSTRSASAAEAERQARARAAERRERLLREGRAGERCRRPSSYVLGRLEVSIDRAMRARQDVEESRRGREQDLMTVRAAAAGARPRARRAGQLGPPRRDGPHPAADADRADRGARHSRSSASRPRGWSRSTVRSSGARVGPGRCRPDGGA